MTNTLILRRISQGHFGTFGMLIQNDEILCRTCERPWKNNVPNVSCIPAGKYTFTKYDSPTNGQVWITQDVPCRSNIEIHSANWPSQVEGCIAVGDGFIRDGKMNIMGVADSRSTMEKLRTLLPDEFMLAVEAITC